MPSPPPEHKELLRGIARRARKRGARAQERAEYLFSSQLDGIASPLADFRSRRAVRIAARELSLAAKAEAILEQWESAEPE